MFISILLFILYGAIACYFLPRMKFLRDSGIKPAFLLILFGCRVATGCLHNWIAWHYYPHHGDLWTFFQESFTTRRELYTSFQAFWADNKRLADLPHNLIEWLHLVLNYFSFDNIYINTLLFNFLTFSGYIALFKVFYQRSGENALCALPFLLLPSILFWTSCIHTEGLVYPLLGWFFYILHQGFTRPWSLRRIIACTFLAALAIFLRPALGPGLIAGILVWWLAESRLPRSVPKITLLSIGGLVIIIIIVVCFPDLLTIIPKTLSARQLEFQGLTGNSRIPLPLLAPEWGSLLKILPRALFNGFFQPLPGSGGQTIYLAFFAELAAIWSIILLSLARVLFPKTSNPAIPSAQQPPPKPSSVEQAHTFHTKNNSRSPLSQSNLPATRVFFIASLFFAIAGICLVGYIIPFAGAIIRYRSLYLPFLLAPFIYNLRSYSLPLSLNRRIKYYIFK